MREKQNSFDPFAVSVMKDKEIVHILITPSSCSKLLGGALKKLCKKGCNLTAESFMDSPNNFLWINKKVIFANV